MGGDASGGGGVPRSQSRGIWGSFDSLLDPDDPLSSLFGGGSSAAAGGGSWASLDEAGGGGGLGALASRGSIDLLARTFNAVGSSFLTPDRLRAVSARLFRDDFSVGLGRGRGPWDQGAPPAGGQAAAPAEAAPLWIPDSAPQPRFLPMFPWSAPGPHAAGPALPPTCALARAPKAAPLKRAPPLPRWPRQPHPTPCTQVLRHQR